MVSGRFSSRAGELLALLSHSFLAIDRWVYSCWYSGRLICKVNSKWDFEEYIFQRNENFENFSALPSFFLGLENPGARKHLSCPFTSLWAEHGFSIYMGSFLLFSNEWEVGKFILCRTVLGVRVLHRGCGWNCLRLHMASAIFLYSPAPGVEMNECGSAGAAGVHVSTQWACARFVPHRHWRAAERKGGTAGHLWWEERHRV